MGSWDWLTGSADTVEMTDPAKKVAAEGTFDPNEAANRMYMQNRLYSMPDNRQQLGQQYSGQMSGLMNGQIPMAYQQNFDNSMARSTNSTLGSALQGLAGRGILNSSVAADSFGGIGRGIAEASAKNYQNNIGQLQELYRNNYNTQYGQTMDNLSMADRFYQDSANRRFAVQADSVVKPGQTGLLGYLAQGAATAAAAYAKGGA